MLAVDDKNEEVIDFVDYPNSLKNTTRFLFSKINTNHSKIDEYIQNRLFYISIYYIYYTLA